MSLKRKIGFVLIILGFLMFLLGIDQFTTNSKVSNPFLSNLGMISFLLWLPTILVGFILVVFSKKRVDKI